MKMIRHFRGASGLELDHLSLALLVTAQLEMLATSQRRLLAVFAFCALHTQDNFLGGLRLKVERNVVSFICALESSAAWSYLLSEDGFGLATEALLFTIVATTTLSSVTFLGLLVLWNLVNAMSIALAAVRATLFWNVDLKFSKTKIY